MPRNARRIEVTPSYCPNCRANFWELVEINLWVCLECGQEIKVTKQEIINQNEGTN